MNDIANLCELVGTNIRGVSKGMRYDECIGKKFLNVGRGYCELCFPKDTKALKYLARISSGPSSTSISPTGIACSYTYFQVWEKMLIK